MGFSTVPFSSQIYKNAGSREALRPENAVARTRASRFLRLGFSKDGVGVGIGVVRALSI